MQASLDHPHICKVYEIGEMPTTDSDDAGYPYIAMQLIGGKPLQHAHQDMSLFEKVRVIQQVAEALHAAHRQGLIHRDIKPRKITIVEKPAPSFPASSTVEGEREPLPKRSGTSQRGRSRLYSHLWRFSVDSSAVLPQASLRQIFSMGANKSGESRRRNLFADSPSRSFASCGLRKTCGYGVSGCGKG